MRLLLPLAAALALLLPPPAGADAVGLVVQEDGTRREVRADAADGVLTSDSTRLHGLVTAADYAARDYRVVEAADPAETVRRLEARIDRNDRLRLPLTVALAAVLIGLALFRRDWALRALLVALAANLWLSPALALAGGLAAVALPLGWACAAVLAVYLASMGLDAETVALSPFGPSQVNRFYGINNLLETMLLVPALLGAARLGRGGIGVAALALVTIGGNRFGADGGGLVVLAAAYAVLWWRLRGRPPWRVAMAAAALVVAMVALDAATGGSSHVTDALSGGPGGLAGDLADRVERSVERTAAEPWSIAVVLGSLALLALTAARARRDAVFEAFLAALAVSLLVNDTPNDVLGMGAAIAVALARDPRRDVLVSWPSMRRTATLLALLALIGGTAAGCGGGEEVGAVPETVEGELPEETTETGEDGGGGEQVEGDAAAGEAVYASAGCGGCHTLEAAGSTGSVGPNLDESQPSLELALDRVRNGQGAMPAYEGQLEPQQIADVAAFVVESSS